MTEKPQPLSPLPPQRQHSRTSPEAGSHAQGSQRCQRLGYRQGSRDDTGQGGTWLDRELQSRSPGARGWPGMPPGAGRQPQLEAKAQIPTRREEEAPPDAHGETPGSLSTQLQDWRAWTGAGSLGGVGQHRCPLHPSLANRDVAVKGCGRKERDDSFALCS